MYDSMNQLEILEVWDLFLNAHYLHHKKKLVENEKVLWEELTLFSPFVSLKKRSYGVPRCKQHSSDNRSKLLKCMHKGNQESRHHKLCCNS